MPVSPLLNPGFGTLRRRILRPLVVSLLCCGPANLAGATADPPPAPASEVAVTYTLSASVEQALRDNPRANAYSYRLLGAVAEAGMARSQMLPAVTFAMGRNSTRNETSEGLIETDYLDQDTDTLTVRLSQPLFAGMTLYNGYQRARLGVELAQTEKDLVASEVALEVQLAFFDLIKARGEVQTFRGAVAQLQSSVAAVRAYEEVRMAPYVDVLKAEVELADAMQRLSKAENEVAVVKIRLNALLGLPTVADVDYLGDFADFPLDFPWTLEQCLERSLQQRYDLLVRRKALAMAEKDAEISAGRFYPRIDFQGSYIDLDKDYTQTVGLGQVDRDYSTTYWTAGVNLEWSLFEGGRNYYGLQRARSEVARAREELRAVTDQVLSQVHSYYLMIGEARQRVAVTAKALGEAVEGEAREQVRFSARVGTITDLLDAQTRLARAGSNHLQARADYQQAVAQLLYVMSEANPSLLF